MLVICCDAHNDWVSKVKNGPRALPKATDILISEERGVPKAVLESPTDRLQWDRPEPERALMPAVRPRRHIEPEGFVELLN